MHRLFVVLSLSAVASGCVRKVDVPEWEPIDVEDMRFRFANPTATSTEAMAVGSDIQAAFDRNQASVAATNRAVSRVRDLVDDPDGEPAPPTRDDEPVSGTTIFLELSCPGPNIANPVTDFTEGTLRIDGPRLSRSVIERARIEGDLLFRFKECRDSDVVIDGEAPAYYDFEDEETIIIDYDAMIVPGSGAAPFAFDVPAIYRTNQVAYLLSTPSETTFVLRYDPTDTTIYEVQTVDAVLDCDSVTQTCTPR